MKRLFVGLLALWIPLMGCTTWAAQHRPPVGGRDAMHSHSHVRVTLRDGTRVELYEVIVRTDSVIGQERHDGFSKRRSLPRDEVSAILPRKLQAGKTALLVVGGAALGAVALIVAVCASGGCAPQFGTLGLVGTP